ncbi:MAG: hypothetical protein IK097_07825 [Clostridia bacterium]|nr:hypothetical protein [Clostridia bacterium]
MFRCFRRNKKAFSLIELIIVVSIMIALVVVMAPAYVKYVTKSHNAVVEAAAESVLAFVKAEISDGAFTGSGEIIVAGRQGDGEQYRTIHIDWQDGNTFMYRPEGAEVEGNGHDLFVQNCGADTTKVIKSLLTYKITVNETVIEGHPQLVEIESTIPGEGG